jgi:hypothetical protein
LSTLTTVPSTIWPSSTELHEAGTDVDAVHGDAERRERVCVASGPAADVEHPHARLEAQHLGQEADLLRGAAGERVPQVGATQVIGGGLEPVIGVGGHRTEYGACVTDPSRESTSRSRARWLRSNPMSNRPIRHCLSSRLQGGRMPEQATPITVAHGDGIGPEIMSATLRILEAGGARLDIETIEIGEAVYNRGISAGIEPEAWDSLRRTKVFLKAPITTPQGGGFKSLNVTVRKTFGMYANVRPCPSYSPFVATKHPAWTW